MLIDVPAFSDSRKIGRLQILFGNVPRLIAMAALRVINSGTVITVTSTGHIEKR